MQTVPVDAALTGETRVSDGSHLLPSDPASRWLLTPRAPRNRRRNPLWRIRRLLLLLALAGVGVLAVTVMLLSQIPLPDTSNPELAETTFICTAEVTETCTRDLAAAVLSSGEDREVVAAYEDIPQVLINAVIATEDQNYYEDSHKGVDPAGIARALYQDIREKSTAQGGSTITQQYVKNAYLTPERSLVRKVREATLAIKLQRELGKDEILRRYLNLIYFGRGAYGIEAASQAYFGEDVANVTLPEAAYLAGLIRSPGGADATDNPEEARRRREVTLVRMVADGYITQTEADRANRTPVSVIAPVSREGLGEVKGAQFGTEYFIEAVRQQLAVLAPDGGLYTQGLRVYTTLDPELQRLAYRTVVNELPPQDPENPAASIVSVDELGRVVAMVGGTDFGQSEVNLALGRAGGGSGRQPGSSFKPFVLAEAIEQNISPRSLYAAPSSIILTGANSGADWSVKGGGSQKGYRDLLDAMRVSSNVVYAQLMLDVKPGPVVQMAERLGVTATLDPVNSLVLGAGEVSVLDMASAYSTFMRTGQHLEPMLIERIEDADGNVLCWYPRRGESLADCSQDPSRPGTQAIEQAVALQVNSALVEVVANGTGRAAQLTERPAAGKTGTTQDARDAWFVGFSCDLATAVWMGYPGAPGEELRTMSDFRGIEVHGGDFPAQMWATFMEEATSTREPCQSLPATSDYSGRILNPDLSTTTTLPFCNAVGTDPGLEGQPTTTQDPSAPTTECLPTPPATDSNGQPIPTTIPPETTPPETTQPTISTPPTTAMPPTTVPTSATTEAASQETEPENNDDG